MPEMKFLPNLDSQNDSGYGHYSGLSTEDEFSMKKLENSLEEDEKNMDSSSSHEIEIPVPVKSSNQTVMLRIQCSNCSNNFTTQEFNDHVCEYDENQQPIRFQEEDEDVDQHPFFALQKKNNRLIRSLLDKFENTEVLSYDCSICARKFARESGFNRHMDRHIGEILPVRKWKHEHLLVVVCNTCGHIFIEVIDALKHLQKNHLKEAEKTIWKRPWSVSTIDEEDEMIPNLFKGISIADDNNNESEKKENIPSIYEIFETRFVNHSCQCEFCGDFFADIRSVLYHESKHDPSEGFSCNTCGINSLNLKQILIHRRTECVNTSKLLDMRNGFICNVCSDSFPTLEALIEHRYTEFHFYPRMEFAKGELRFLCEFCLEDFPIVNNLVDHYKEHHKKKNLVEAEDSPNKVKRTGGISFTSTRYRQYLCEICGKSYTQSSHLWQHLRFHRGVKPFACSVEGCDRRFTIRPDLNDHIRKCHTGERPYHCSTCDKRFLTGSVYYQHRLIHRGERRYGCDDCGKRFYRADALKNHQRIHTGEKPYNCPHCVKAFRQRGDRDKHIKARHPGLPGISPIRKPPKFSFGKGRTKNVPVLSTVTLTK